MTAPGGGLRISLAVELPDAPPPLVVDRTPDGTTVNGEASTALLTRLDAEHALFRDTPGGEAHLALVIAAADAPMAATGMPSGIERHEIVIDGWRIELTSEPEARASLRERARRGRAEAGASGPTKVHAIIPGVVVAVSVAQGDEVTAGQQLLVIEAMKMQNELRAPRDGTVEQLAVGTGSRVEVGDLLLVLA